MSDEREYSVATVLDELEKNGVYVSNTIGYSMRPMLSHHRDVVIIKSPEVPPRKYDVILYRGGKDSFILHRIVGVKTDYYIVRGDNTYRDEHVPKDEVIGVLVGFNRKGRRHTTSDLSYKLYSRIWCFIYPIRALWRNMRIALSNLRKRMFGK